MKTEDIRKEIINSYILRWSKNRYDTDESCKWTINTDFSVDIIGSIHIPDVLTKLPFKIRKVSMQITLTDECILSMENFENFPEFPLTSVDPISAAKTYFSCFPNHPSYNKDR